MPEVPSSPPTGETVGGVQGGAAVTVFDVDVRAAVGKELDDLVEALLGGAEEGCAAIAVGSIEYRRLQRGRA